MGFQLAGWTRTPRTAPGIALFAGMAQLPEFLPACDIVVSLLPDTPDTRGILNARSLSWLPAGAGVVNAGRGTAIVLPDLIAALDSGHISTAVLDVFETEPLPPDSPAWRHPRIIVTPHNAAYASCRARAEAVVSAMGALMRGDTPAQLCDRVRGY